MPDTEPRIQPSRTPPAGVMLPDDHDALAFLDALARALEDRDATLRQHAQRVGFYADLLAEALGLDDDTRGLVRTASILHDVGRISLAENDMRHAELTDRGQDSLEAAHTHLGARLVRALGFEERVGDAIRHHHENWDGEGGPDGLCRENIPLAARIIAIADAFDRLTAAPSGAQSLDADQALFELNKNAGARLDPGLLSLFASLIENGAFELDADREGTGRSDARAEAPVRLARYSTYPRRERSHGVRSGYTRSAASGSMTLVTAAPENIGELLRIRIQNLGEHDGQDTLARVVSCRHVHPSRFELSLAALATHARAGKDASMHSEHPGERLGIGREST